MTPEDSSRSATRVSLIAELNAELDILQYRDAPFVGSLVSYNSLSPLLRPALTTSSASLLRAIYKSCVEVFRCKSLDNPAVSRQSSAILVKTVNFSQRNSD